jgi:L-rhamnose-H+ transport protein
MGTMAVFGTLIPALVLESGLLRTPQGGLVVASLGLIILGLVLASVAGAIRDRMKAAGAANPTFRILGSTGFRKGLILCVLSGALSACFNLGFALTTAISNAAIALGSSANDATFAVWALVMGAGSVPNVVFCYRAIVREDSFGRLWSGRGNWFHMLVVSLLWIFSVKLYGDGAVSIGSRGATIAWPILVSSTIVSATALGVFTAEWSGADWRVRTCLYVGSIVLLGAVVVAALAGVG